MEEGPEDTYEDKNFRDDEGDYSVPDGSLDMGCVVSKGKAFGDDVRLPHLEAEEPPETRQ